MKPIQSFEEKNSVKTLLIYILISMWVIGLLLIWGQYNGEVTIDSSGYRNSVDVNVINGYGEEIPVKIENDYDEPVPVSAQ